jgi:hypothetical protein
VSRASTCGIRRSGRLAFALIAVACGSSGGVPPYSQLQFPAGIALANGLLLISSQDDDELHVYDTRQNSYILAPSPLLPLSIPTVRRPGLVCSDGTQAYVLASNDPLLAVIDAQNDPSSNDPPTGLRELGQVSIRSRGNALSCGPAPEAVLQYKIDAGGSPAGYEAALDAGTLSTDMAARDLMRLPSAALVAVVDDAGLTVIQEVSNDAMAVGAECQKTMPIVTCDAGASPFCMGPRYFCPSTQQLLTLRPQDPYCNPIGPPNVLSMDLSGSSLGAENLFHPMIGAEFANLLVVADANSSCIALVNLDDRTTTWVQAGGPTLAVALVTPLPNTCVPGGSLVGAVLDPSGCDGGLCGGEVFIDVAKALADPQRGRLPAPVPYPFEQSPDWVEAPVRVSGLATALTFTGSNLQILGSTTTSPVVIQLAAAVGNANADLTLVEIGMGIDGGGTGPVNGTFPCPPGYLAPRLLDVNDYATTPVPPQINTLTVLDYTGTALPVTIPNTLEQPVTSFGGVLPTYNRLGQPFPIPSLTNQTTMTPANCYGYAVGSEICFTDGLVQHGAAQDDIFTVRYQGPLDQLSSVSGTWDPAGPTVTVPLTFDPAAHLGGVLTAETANLGVTLAANGVACDNGISQFSSNVLDGGGFLATFGLQTPDGGTAGCPPAGAVQVTVFAAGAKPYTVEGITSGFVGLWPNDGRLQLVTTGRWQYPRDLIQMVQQAQNLSDLVLGLPLVDAGTAPGSTLPPPRPLGLDEIALDSAFGMALRGPLGPAVVVEDGGNLVTNDAGVMLFAGVVPQRGAYWTFIVSSGVTRLKQSPLDGVTSVVEAMTAQIDSDGGQHVYASCRGGNGLIDAQPGQTLDPYTQGIFEVH